MPYVFFIILILLPAITNLKELHAMQRHVLPGEQHEAVTLVPGIARQLKSHTGSNALILTNLQLEHTGLKGGPMLNFYAERRIQGNIETVSELEKHLALPFTRPVNFLLWLDKERDQNSNSALGAFLDRRYPYDSYTVEGHAFRSYRLR